MSRHASTGCNLEKRHRLARNTVTTMGPRKPLTLLSDCWEAIRRFLDSRQRPRRAVHRQRYTSLHKDGAHLLPQVVKKVSRDGPARWFTTRLFGTNWREARGCSPSASALYASFTPNPKK